MKTETKVEHTAGPWQEMLESDKGQYAIYGPIPKGGRWEPRIAQVIDSSDDETVKANARLIAAAPDLLEALENILKGRRKGDKERFYWLEVEIEDDIAADDAIKKARGF